MKIIIRYGYETKISKISHKKSEEASKIYRNFVLYDAKEWKNKEKGDNTGEEKRRGASLPRCA